MRRRTHQAFAVQCHPERSEPASEVEGSAPRRLERLGRGSFASSAAVSLRTAVRMSSWAKDPVVWGAPAAPPHGASSGWQSGGSGPASFQHSAV